jgi:hypothetical protein
MGVSVSRALKQFFAPLRLAVPRILIEFKKVADLNRP